MSFYYQNVRGLRTKTRDVFLNSSILNFDVFALTETWLNPTILDLELFNNSYTVFRKDRYSNLSDYPNGVIPKGGGVLIALKNNFNANQVIVPGSEDLEIIIVKIELLSKNLYLVNCYIPPSSNSDIYTSVGKTIDFICNDFSPKDELILCGDFNLPNLSWIKHDEEHFMIPKHIGTECEYVFIDKLNTNYLQQVSEICNFQGKQLDLVFTSEWNNLVFCENTLPLIGIDKFHPPLSFSLCVNSPINSDYSNSYSFNFNKANFAALTEFINSFDFYSVFNNTDINIMTIRFYEIIFEGFRQFVPKSKNRNPLLSPPWFNSDLRKLRNKKNKAWRYYLKSKNSHDYNRFKILFEEFKRLSNLLYNEFISSTSSKLISNPKCFWKFVNSKRKCDEFPSHMKYNGTSSNDSEIISNFFREYFCSSYSDSIFTPNYNDFSHLDTFPKTTWSNINCNEGIIKMYLDKLGNNNLPGPDGIPEIILKKCSSALAIPLSILFNSSLNSGVFPLIWKHSYIRPIHKKNAKNEIINYRPIAKLSSLPKLFELIMYDSIHSHCKSFLVHNQHGYMDKKSTVTNLVESVSAFTKNMEEGFQTDVIFTDYSKAFDVLPHSIILLKLKKLGFPNIFVKWVDSYLSDRTYSVLFRNITSKPFNANSGVPQGSHLGPLFFIISVNDVSSVIVNSELQIYADDMKIFKKIESLNDALLLQNDLDNFFKWCKNNNLLLNVNKCALMCFTRRLNPICFNYCLNGISVSKTNSIKDLGVYFDDKLNFKLHFCYIINKANSMLGFIKRWSKEFNDPYVLKSLYSCLVRPNLEYASQVWSPFYEVHINRIEAVQRNFLRFSLRNLQWSNPLILPPYEHRLNLIQLKTLKL